MSRGKPKITDEDRAIGARIRQARIMAGLTQMQLANVLGCTYQQVHKREIGINRVPVSSLKPTAAACGIGVADLLDLAGSETIDGGRLNFMIRLSAAAHTLDNDRLHRIVAIVEDVAEGFAVEQAARRPGLARAKRT